jgi:1-acyl-sn-glycerol-3-phosphate acyltransferase
MLKLIRYILVFTLVGISSIAGLIICILRPFHPNNATMYGKFIGKVGLKILGIKVVVENRHLWFLHSPVLAISNHQHNLDIFVCGSILHTRIVSLGKKQLLYLPFFGIFYWLSGNILIDRSNKQKAWDSMEKVKKAIQENDTSIWMMPEGTRSQGKGLQPFKKGAFITAIAAQTKILPIVISDYCNNIDLNKWHSATVHIKLFPPIETVGLTEQDAPALMKQCHDLFKTQLSS